MIRKLLLGLCLLLAVRIVSAEESVVQPPPIGEPGIQHTIREIHIDTFDVFDPRIPHYDSFPFRVLNGMHIKTKDSFVRRSLLMKEGDVFDEDVMHESERNLRKNTFLGDVRIESRVVGPNQVDLYVHTEDQWTLELNASAGTSAGYRTYDFDVQESNFLGYGKQVGVMRFQDPERTTSGFNYEDPQFLNSRWKHDTVIQSSSDGWRYATDTIRPFFSLDTRWAYGGAWDSGTYVTKLYHKSKAAAEIDTEHRSGLFFVARAWGSRYDKKKVGILFNADNTHFPRPARIIIPEYSSVKEISESLHPIDQDAYHYGAIFMLDRRHYIEETYIDNFGQVEDLPNGFVAGTMLGRSETVTSLPSYFEVRSMIQFSRQLNNHQYFTAFADFLSHKPMSSGFNNTIFSGYAHYYVQSNGLKLGPVYFPRQTLGANFSAVLTSKVDAPYQISLGENEGLRGYTFKSFTGQNLVLMNIEDRIFTPLNYRLFGIAVAAFVDSGYAWSSEDHLRFNDFGVSVGVGLRIGLKKSQSGRVVRVDFAVPLNQNGFAFKQNSGFSISISSGQIFTALGAVPRIFQLF